MEGRKRESLGIGELEAWGSCSSTVSRRVQTGDRRKACSATGHRLSWGLRGFDGVLGSSQVGGKTPDAQQAPFTTNAQPQIQGRVMTPGGLSPPQKERKRKSLPCSVRRGSFGAPQAQQKKNTGRESERESLGGLSSQEGRGREREREREGESVREKTEFATSTFETSDPCS